MPPETVRVTEPGLGEVDEQIVVDPETLIVVGAVDVVPVEQLDPLQPHVQAGGSAGVVHRPLLQVWCGVTCPLTHCRALPQRVPGALLVGVHTRAPVEQS